MSIKLSTKRKWSRRVTRLKKAVIEHKDWTGIWGLWLLTQSSAILYKSLQDSIPLMLSIYQFFGSLQPSVTANPLLRALYANLLFWPFVGVFLLLKKLMYLLLRKEPEVSVQDPIVLYKDELAAAIFAIDEQKSEEAVRDSIWELIITIVDTICVNLGLRRKDFRLYFVVPRAQEKQGTDEENVALSMVRFGQVFDLLKKGKISDTEFEDIYQRDEQRVKVFLTDDKAKTENYVKLDGSPDATVLLFARNPGKYLRMGLYIAVTKENAEISDFKEVFPEVSQIISTLGFIDEIVEFVRKYGQEGGDGNEQQN
ncbi:hypothetical protein [Effusibacillus pohliae]|uniref:hypothetical protein n=1 Tax=Effusibacillus pohliae TaxID=232270 RepID=UPI000374F23A|nr:hypothetical protein [Effusibacillus pohliae]